MSDKHGLLIEVVYDGATFHGWALQPGVRTVAGEVLAGIQTMDPGVTEIRGVSRTDAGVHARGQLAAFDAVKPIPPRGWVLGLGTRLPNEVAVRVAWRVEAGYEPRRHAVGKHYRYTILNDNRRDPFYERSTWRIGAKLNLAWMQAEAAAIVGTHDFSAFRSSQDDRQDPVRTIHSIDIVRAPEDERLLRFEVRGGGFMHNMIRIIAGTLIDVGRGQLAPGACERALESKSRAQLGQTAPPQGLCLESVTLDGVGISSDRWPRSGANDKDAAT